MFIVKDEGSLNLLVNLLHCLQLWKILKRFLSKGSKSLQLLLQGRRELVEKLVRKRKELRKQAAKERK